YLKMECQSPDPNCELWYPLSRQSSNVRPVQAANWREFEICSSGKCKLADEARARNEQDVDLTSSGGAEVSTADNSLMNKLLVRKPEPHELLNPICLSRLDESYHFGRLSLVHQPEICFASPGLLCSNTYNEEQKRTGGAAMGQTELINELNVNFSSPVVASDGELPSGPPSSSSLSSHWVTQPIP
ncbi:hypothetical protein MJO29_006675, partial [Puccinia striiformis f. sp. tritici]